MNEEEQLEQQEEQVPSWMNSFMEEVRKSNESLREEFEARLSQSQQSEPGETIPGTNFTKPSGYDYWEESEKNAYISSQYQNSVQSEVHKGTSPLLADGIINRYGKDLSDEGRVVFQSMITELSKENPSQLAQLNEQGIRFMMNAAEGDAVIRSRKSSLPDAKASSPEGQLSEARQNLIEAKGQAFSDATTDEELREFYGL